MIEFVICKQMRTALLFEFVLMDLHCQLQNKQNHIIMTEQMSKTRICILLGTFILVAAIHSTVLELQNIQIVDRSRQFYHPFIQNSAMFLGQTLFMILHFINPTPSIANPLPKYSIVLLATMQFFATTIPYLTSEVNNSAFNVGIILSSIVFSKVIMKESYNKYCCLAIVLVLAGSILSRVLPEILGSFYHFTTLSTVGLIISLILTGLQWTYQEHLLKTYRINKVQLLGLEGSLCFFMNALLVLSLNFIKCPSKFRCAGNNIEDIVAYFSELKGSLVLSLMSILSVFTGALNFYLAFIILKRFNTVCRGLTNACSTIIVWLIAIVITKTFGQHNHVYILTDVSVRNVALGLSGLFLAILGIMIYCQILCAPATLGSDQSLITSGIFHDKNQWKIYRTSNQNLT